MHFVVQEMSAGKACFYASLIPLTPTGSWQVSSLRRKHRAIPFAPSVNITQNNLNLKLKNNVHCDLFESMQSALSIQHCQTHYCDADVSDISTAATVGFTNCKKKKMCTERWGEGGGVAAPGGVGVGGCGAAVFFCSFCYRQLSLT